MSEINMIEAQLGNYRENIGILLEKVEDEVRKANELNRCYNAESCFNIMFLNIVY